MSGKAVRETLGFLAVVAGLVFVGLEIQQNTSATEGATLQAISDMHTTLLLEGNGDPEFVDLFGRVLGGVTGPDLSGYENLRMNRFYIAFLSHLENTYLQNQAGILSDDVFESYGWRNRIWASPHFLERSESLPGVAVSPEFAEFFRSQTADLEPADGPIL